MNWATALDWSGRQMICLVGAGGKSGLMSAMARACSAAGQKVLVTTSTRMYARQLAQLCEPIIEEGGSLNPSRLLDRLGSALSHTLLVTAAAGFSDSDKVAGFSPAELDSIWNARLFDLILVEADGARGRSLKVPAVHEPTLPRHCTGVLAVAGIDALGRPLNDAYVHRAGLAADLTEWARHSIVDAALIACIISRYRNRSLDTSPHIPTIPVINKTDTPPQIRSARQICAALQAAGFQRILITSLHAPDPIREVVTL